MSNTDLTERYWDSELQEWVYPSDIDAALHTAQLAIDEYYNGDRAWAERWLLRAFQTTNVPKP